MVLGLYGVALVIGLWKMYKPRGVRLPEYKDDNLSMDLPDDPIIGFNWGGGAGVGVKPDPGQIARARQFLNLKEIDDYSKDYSEAVEKYNKRRRTVTHEKFLF